MTIDPMVSQASKPLVAPNPRVKWCADNAKGRVLLVGEEDKEYWEEKATILPLGQQYPILEKYDCVILPEVLQRATEPVALLQKMGRVAPKLLITVPFEHLWDAKFKPFQNKAFHYHYNAESLADLLDGVGVTYRMQLLLWEGWAWLTVEAW